MATRQKKSKGKRRPTADDVDGVLLAISEGQSLRKACEEAGLDAPSTYKMIDEDAELRQQYARARAMGGDVYVDQMKGVTAGTLAKKIQPDVARVVSDNLKWISGRMAPKAWGDRHQHEVGGLPDGEKLTVEIVRFGDEK
jgi:hypothetical protein